MLFRQLIEPSTSTYTYLLADPVSREAVLIDPQLESVERDSALIEELGLELVATLETHVHAVPAGRATAADQLRARFGSQRVIAAAAQSRAVGAERWVGDGDQVFFGDRWLEVRATPGHTPTCVSYVLDDLSAVFTGDALWVRKTGYADLDEGGDPGQLYVSITTQLFTLPDDTKVYPGHDERGHTCSTIGEERAHSVNIGAGLSQREFVELPVTRNDFGIPEVDGAWVAAHPEVQIIDVRDFDEWSEGHIDGAELVPAAQVPGRTTEWGRDRAVVLVCRSGVRSGRVAQQLESTGFRRVASLRGGILAWAEQGHKLAC